MGQAASTPGGLIESIRNNENMTPEQLRAILNRGISIEERDSSQHTALHYAIAYNKTNLVPLLVDIGHASYTNISLRGTYSDAISCAVVNHRHTILQYLLSKNPASASLLGASNHSKPVLVKLMMEADDSPDFLQLGYLAMPAFLGSQYPQMHGIPPSRDPVFHFAELLTPKYLGTFGTRSHAFSRGAFKFLSQTGVRCYTRHVTNHDIPQYYKPWQPIIRKDVSMTNILIHPEFPHGIELPIEPASHNTKAVQQDRHIRLSCDGRTFIFSEMKGIIFKDVVSTEVYSVNSQSRPYLLPHSPTYVHVVLDANTEFFVNTKSEQAAKNLEMGLHLLFNAVIPSRPVRQRFNKHVVLVSVEFSKSRIVPFRVLCDNLDRCGVEIEKIYNDELTLARENCHNEANAAFQLRSKETSSYMKYYNDALSMLAVAQPNIIGIAPPVSTNVGPGGVYVIDSKSHSVIANFLRSASSELYNVDPILTALRNDNIALAMEINKTIEEFRVIQDYHNHPAQATSINSDFHARMAVSYSNFYAEVISIQRQAHLIYTMLTVNNNVPHGSTSSPGGPMGQSPSGQSQQAPVYQQQQQQQQKSQQPPLGSVAYPPGYIPPQHQAQHQAPAPVSAAATAAAAAAVSAISTDDTTASRPSQSHDPSAKDTSTPPSYDTHTEYSNGGKDAPPSYENIPASSQSEVVAMSAETTPISDTTTPASFQPQLQPQNQGHYPQLPPPQQSTQYQPQLHPQPHPQPRPQPQPQPQVVIQQYQHQPPPQRPFDPHVDSLSLTGLFRSIEAAVNNTLHQPVNPNQHQQRQQQHHQQHHQQQPQPQHYQQPQQYQPQPQPQHSIPPQQYQPTSLGASPSTAPTPAFQGTPSTTSPSPSPTLGSSATPEYIAQRPAPQYEP